MLVMLVRGGVYVESKGKRGESSEVGSGDGQPSKERTLLHITSSPLNVPAHFGDLLGHTSTTGVLVVSSSCLRLFFR